MPARSLHRNFLLVLLAIAIASLFYFVPEKEPLRGQLNKQAFMMEFARSYSRGEVSGIFPVRHFLEIYHEKPLAWAEEFPVYPVMMALLSRCTSAPFAVAGRLITLAFFLSLLWASSLLGRMLGVSEAGPKKSVFQDMDLILPTVFALYPVFRLYSVSIMPEIPMAALCFWGVLDAFRSRWKRAAVFLAIAALFKFYAVFTTLGLAFYAISISRDQRKSWRKILVERLLPLALSTIPVMAYLGWIFASGVANPIVEYRMGGSAGHLVSAASLGSLHSYLRICTWVLIKNGTIVGSLFAIVGLVYLLRSKSPLGKLALCLLASGFLFAIVFLNSFFVHDYYGIQIALATAFLTAVGIGWLGMRWGAKIRWTREIALLLLAIFGFSLARSAFRRQGHYVEAARIINQVSQGDGSPLLEITTQYPSPLLYLLDRVSWSIDPRLFAEHEAVFRERLQDPRVKWVAVYLLVDDVPYLSPEIMRRLQAAKWTKLAHDSVILPEQRKGQGMRLWIFQRTPQ